MSILVTGVAGFIGSYVAKALLAKGCKVVGVDDLNPYYSVDLKKARLEPLKAEATFTFHHLDIADYDAITAALNNTTVEAAIHLAAQAGVRHSIDHPFDYGRANLLGHLSILEFARARTLKHLVYASSSSVYGKNTEIPYGEAQMTDAPASLYGATKKSNELMSAAYASLYDLPQTGLRFFTVYGPLGRPDMAYWIFTEKMLKGEPIDIFNRGDMGRDFTYIDDIVDGVLAALDHPPDRDSRFHQVFNLGNDRPETLMTLVECLETALGVEAVKQFKPMQSGDVQRTWADISAAQKQLGYTPKTTLKEGIAQFVSWRRSLATPF